MISKIVSLWTRGDMYFLTLKCGGHEAGGLDGDKEYDPALGKDWEIECGECHAECRLNEK